MRNSDELLVRAVAAAMTATGCTTPEAEAMVHAISAYIARFNAEIINRSGPAHEFAARNGI